MDHVRQIWTLTRKNLLIALWRRWFTTPLRALILPIAFAFFLSYVRNFFLPPSNYGFGSPRPLRHLTTDAIGSARGSRDTVAFVHNGFRGGQIEDLIDSLATPLAEAGADVRILSGEEELFSVCRSSLSGVSGCYAAASFHSSPTEGIGDLWNYTARADASLGNGVFVDRGDNDVQVFSLPFVHAIDSGIATLSGRTLPDMDEYPYTHQTRKERDDEILRLFMGAIIDFLGVCFFIGICGITYQLTGHMAVERELGISQLIDAMSPNRHQWQTQAARLFATHVAFDIIYLPGWIGIGLVISLLVFASSSAGIIVPYHILMGLSLSGYSILWGSLFRKAQLSGIVVTIGSIIFAIIAQVTVPSGSAAVAMLSLLFPPMNYTLFIIYLARWERQLLPANLTEGAPESPWQLPGYVFFICIVIQIIAYPVLGALIERGLYGTASESRKVLYHSIDKHDAVKLVGFSKQYRPGWWHRNVLFPMGRAQKETVKAVSNLDLKISKGQIMVLLGANGSGKSTTLDAVSGLNTVTAGSIEVEGTGGLGLCPQKNVMWAELTVYEHVDIFSQFKSPRSLDRKAQILGLVKACDLEKELKKKAKTLSGGQKRKLQLAIMFAGGSRVCCVDEVSSGLDPLSRRKIWDILLAERGSRTFLFTTHALDEADVLSDRIAVLSKGHLKAEGSAIELKDMFGGGYRVNVVNSSKLSIPPEYKILARKVSDDQTVFQLANSADAALFISWLEREGVLDYQLNGPTIEDVFLTLAEEGAQELSGQEAPMVAVPAPSRASDAESALSALSSASKTESSMPQLLRGKGSSQMRQTWILFRKRIRILSRNYLPHCAAVLIPILTAGLATFYLTGFSGITCSPGELANNPRVATLGSLERYWGLLIPAGPASRFTPEQIPTIFRPYADLLRPVDSFDEFQTVVRDDFRDVNPGGFWLGDNPDDTPLLAYRASGGLQYSALAKNLVDSIVTNTTILTQFSTFALPFAASTGDSLQLIMYFALAMSAYPGFFALYPTFERLGNIRALHFSNGLGAGPLWLAYIMFDVIFITLVSVVAIAIFVAISDLWFSPGYLFVIFFLFGMASTLLGYVVSLFAKSQLAAFALTVGGQAVCLLVYFIMYVALVAFSPPENLRQVLNVVQFTFGLITPSGNLLRAMLLTLNQSQLLCRDQSFVAYPGEVTAYGGPILYLVLQAIVLFTFLVWHDSGYRLRILTRRTPQANDEEKEGDSGDQGVFDEIRRTEKSDDGLRLLHLNKAFGSDLAVQDVTFGVGHGEVFALLGPNGAGKSTTISLIRGDIRPSYDGGDVFVEGDSISKHRTAARGHLGVCPQFDAMDQMTVIEHLRFYASVCGVPNIEHNAAEVLTAVGLEPFRDRMAGKLSGGSKRKLSLGIAIMGNPSVLLLDEPSSGMDAVSKRVMWKSLNAVKSSRSLVITTHSMEEADALADRIGILAQKMLALGTSASLRRTHGAAYHVHLVHRLGPSASAPEMERVKQWVLARIPGTIADTEPLHGQLRFSVPKQASPPLFQKKGGSGAETEPPPPTGIASLLALLERSKAELNVEHYSVTAATLDEVFLSIVGKHRTEKDEEENSRPR
ncbi:MAG: hypothetical protein M1837_001254 [Sclerophora amabilis]|nr:MAG: hypothetical protein M1837_001254 [Sclerophora amabilis]